MTSYRHNTWHTLVGAIVEVRKHGAFIREGLVEDAMADSSALWIAAAGISDRQIIEAAEGYEIWVEPQELEGQHSYRMTTAALQMGQ